MAVKAFIDLGRYTVLAGSVPAPVFKDKRAGVLATDQDGRGIWSLNLIVVEDSDDGDAQVWKVKVVGEPKGLVKAQPVKVTGLVMTEWAIDGKQGLAFRAESIAPLVAVPAGKAAA